MNTIPKLALLLPLLAAPPALAQGTEAQRAACGPDAFRLCASSIPDPGRIAACLRRERERLSGACRAMLDEGDRTSRTAAAPAPREVAKSAEAAPARTARPDRGRRVAAAETRLPRQAEAAATPRERPARAERIAVRRASSRVAGLDRPARATPRTVARAEGLGSPGDLSGLEAQAQGWHRTLAGYADSIERQFARVGSAEAGRVDFGRLPRL